ncbi:FHA domain-containing protein [Sandaracinus amylolyticus]|uniref:FHA domain-containing protein n=1 Tax=Sandaracinus amylolyticus TaxID=927083 RepID=UPI001F00A5E6|nr:FHA domain-containing protein [Sandaracinus amylolyticus]UJR81774.1 Phosphopeptide-binding protein [Sandaracinus amylolyticus]
MIVCPRCGKENQDHYKFCLGCGAELPRDAAHAPKSFTAATPPAGFQGGSGGASGGFGAPPPVQGSPAPRPGGFGPPPGGGFGPPPPVASPAPSSGFGAPAAPMGAPPSGGFGPPPAISPAAAPPMPAAAAPSAGGDTVTCPKCGSSNNKNFKFCGTCGHPLQGASAAPPPMAAPVSAPAVSSGPKRGSLVLIRPDGSEGDSFPLSDVTVVGREAGGLFASDSYLSPRHATFSFGAGGLTVRDESSLNGVYIRIAADTPSELRDGAIFRIGQEIIRFERLKAAPAQHGVEVMGSPSAGLVGRICLIIGRETAGNCYAIPATGLHLGRERGDILFPDDGYVSGLHCRLHEEGGRMLITDVGSSNGTFLRITGSVPVPSGSLLLMGQQLFRVEF